MAAIEQPKFKGWEQNAHQIYQLGNGDANVVVFLGLKYKDNVHPERAARIKIAIAGCLEEITKTLTEAIITPHGLLDAPSE